MVLLVIMTDPTGSKALKSAEMCYFCGYEKCFVCLPREHLQESDGGVYHEGDGAKGRFGFAH